ncbi:MAG TPA: cupin domain-containing protein [Candidatus Goldiibacteriota bacterium]|nr:cupin domain-containing protein [Candidatus Goldiibacteriota bacterium]
MAIIVLKPNRDEMAGLNVFDWPIWEKEVSKFSWHYDDSETCFILEGKARVTAGNETVTFEAGDLVVFPKGLDCVWEVIEPVKKHYRFG